MSLKPQNELEIGPRTQFDFGLHELWRYRELFYFFTWRDVKVKYKHTYLGITWAVLQPLILTFIFALFFGERMKDETDLPYPVFAFSGLLLWLFFSGGLIGAGNSMVSNAEIIRKVYFPRFVIPVSSILTSLFDFLLALPALAALLVWWGCAPRVAAPIYFLSGLLLAAAATLGAGCWLSALSVKYRDFKYILPFLIQILLFVTPVIYPVTYLKRRWVQKILALNPMSGAVTLFRGMISELPIDWTLMSISVGSAAVLLFLGLWYFRRTEDYFADLA